MSKKQSAITSIGQGTRSKVSAMHEAMNTVESWQGSKEKSDSKKNSRTLSLTPETTQTASRFVELMETSIRRWERVIYPTLLSLFLMFGLAAFLIYELSSDMSKIAKGFDPQMEEHMSKLTNHMADLSTNIDKMTRNIDVMGVNVDRMAKNTATMTKKMDYLATMAEIKTEMQLMNRSISRMGQDMGIMRYDVSGMNQAVGKPMRFFSSFMPF